MNVFTRNHLYPLLIVWTILILTSLSSWQIGSQSQISGTAAAILVVAFIALKIHLIGRYFMELSHAPRLLAIAFDMWIAAVGVMILVML
jgi:cytochrome c oxidase subunit IV